MNETSARSSNPVLALALQNAENYRAYKSRNGYEQTIVDLADEVERLRAAHETNARQEALQEWRDSCHCGCDACVALIETLELESSSVKANERYWMCSCKPPGNFNIESVSICKDCGTVRPALNGDASHV